ncbi:MAG: hypothetical protein WAJ85_11685 [Candidatus Baltobacteraceae bacterium]
MAIVIAAVIATLPQSDPTSARIRIVTKSKPFQIAAVLAVALAVCLLAYKTARDGIRVVRSGLVNPATITFAPNAESKYPQILRQRNEQSGLFVVLDTTDDLYVLVQQRPDPTIPAMPDAQVFSIRKTDIASVETHVP